jgi:hypothetical protein
VPGSLSLTLEPSGLWLEGPSGTGVKLPKKPQSCSQISRSLGYADDWIFVGPEASACGTNKP